MIEETGDENNLSAGYRGAIAAIGDIHQVAVQKTTMCNVLKQSLKSKICRVALFIFNLSLQKVYKLLNPA